MQLEAKLNLDKESRGFEYNFLSEVKNEKVRNSLLDKHKNQIPGAQLLVAPESEIFENLLTSASTTLDTSIWHDGFVENGPFPFKVNILSTSEIGMTQVSAFQPSIIHPSSSQISLTQVSTTKISNSQVSSIQLGTAEIAIAKTSLPETSSMQIGSVQISSVQNSFGEVRSTQFGMAQVSSNQGDGMEAGSSQINTAKVNTIKNFAFSNYNTSEIPFPSSTSSTQLLSSYLHNFAPTLIINRYKINSDGKEAVKTLGIIESIFGHKNTIRLSSSIEILTKAVQIALDKKAPCHKGKNSVADTIIYLQFENLVKETESIENKDYFHFVTANHTDFSSKDNREPHENLIIFTKNNVYYHIDPYKALEEIELEDIPPDEFDLFESRLRMIRYASSPCTSVEGHIFNNNEGRWFHSQFGGGLSWHLVCARCGALLDTGDFFD